MKFTINIFAALVLVLAALSSDARGQSITRVYDVRDLIQPIPSIDNPPQLGLGDHAPRPNHPASSRSTAKQNLDNLIEQSQTTKPSTAPNGW